MGIIDYLMKKINAAANNWKNIIGCISPYKKQVLRLNERLRTQYGAKYREHIAVNTVDAFQVKKM